MATRSTFPILIMAAMFIGSIGCDKSNDSTTETSQLTAAPPSVSVTAGNFQTVSISGGTPPYSIGIFPELFATATLSNADSTVALLTITGVSSASAATAVTIKDAPDAKMVTVPITVH